MYGMCRVCLNESHSYSHIYENLMRGDHLYVVLNDVCQLDVKLGDGLPEFMCCDCYKKVSEFESFKRTSHEGSAALQRMKNEVENVHLVPVKMEVEDSTPEEVNHLEVYIKSEIVTGEDGFIAEETEIPTQSEEESANYSFVPVKIEMEVGDPLCLDEADGARDTGQPFKDFIQPDMDSTEDEGFTAEETEVSDAPGCFSEEIRIQSEAECSRECFNDQRQLNISIKKDDLEVNLSNCHKDSLGQDNRVDALPIANLKKRSTAKKKIPKTDLTGSKKEIILKKKSVKIKSPLDGSKAATSKELAKRFYCDICNKGFIDKSKLGCHVRVHNGVKPFKCSICDRSFQTKSNLNSHKVVHSYGGPHACNQCDKSFKEEFYLTKHMETHKNEHCCKVCGKIFSNKNSLAYHRRLHRNYNTFPCVTCGRGFKCELDFNQHLKSHGVKYPNHCKICGKGFPSGENLRQHQLTHKGIKPFSCNLCGKNFKWKNSLKLHTDAHKGLKHKCSVCGKELNSKHYLQRHMKSHSELKTYSCPNCGKAFGWLENLKVHLKFSCKAE